MGKRTGIGLRSGILMAMVLAEVMNLKENGYEHY